MRKKEIISTGPSMKQLSIRKFFETGSGKGVKLVTPPKKDWAPDLATRPPSGWNPRREVRDLLGTNTTKEDKDDSNPNTNDPEGHRAKDVDQVGRELNAKVAEIELTPK